MSGAADADGRTEGTAPRLEVVDLRKRYRGQDGTEVAALDGVSFTVEPGEFVTVIGPSGCGKSTLFDIIGGLLEADGGTAAIDGEAIRGVPPALGLMIQDDTTLPWRTALDNVALPLEIAGVSRVERRRRAQAALLRVGLAGFEEHRPATLSVGMRQRVALARTLIAAPRLLLLDEPFTALDAQTRLGLGDDLLAFHGDDARTTVLVTHDLTEAALLSDRIVVLTPRPARVKTIVTAPLPSPRSSALLGHPQLADRIHILWDALRAEGLRADRSASMLPSEATGGAGR